MWFINSCQSNKQRTSHDRDDEITRQGCENKSAIIELSKINENTSMKRTETIKDEWNENREMGSKEGKVQEERIIQFWGRKIESIKTEVQQKQE